MVKILQTSLVLAVGLLVARPLCCCAAEGAEEPVSSNGCCPVEREPSPANHPAPCSRDEPCQDCNTTTLIALESRGVCNVVPTHANGKSLTLPPVVLRVLAPRDADLACRPAWFPFPVDLSPPFLCVFRT